ncbi:hypothetical protein ACJX0J_010383 [Zea mays]
MALALVITTAISFLNMCSHVVTKLPGAQIGSQEKISLQINHNVALQNVRLISAAPMRSRSPRWLGKSILTMPVDAAIMPNANLIYDITRKVQVDHTFCAVDLQSLFSPPVPIIPSISASNTE